MLFVDQSLNQIGDVLLPASGRVEPAAHLGESAIDVSAEVTEVLTLGIETRCRSVSEVADLGSDLGDVAVGCAGEHSGCGGIFLGHPEASFDFTEIILAHTESLTPRWGRRLLSAWLPPAVESVLQM